MALQAKQIDVAQLQHVGIWSAVSQMARLAAIHLHGRVFEHKRSLLVRVAFEADSVLGGGSPQLVRLHRAVHVVAIAALDQPFIHAMMERHIELRFLLEMAPIAKFGLGLYEQEIRILTVVRRMTGNATDVILRMHGVDCIHVLRAAGVAGQALGGDFFGGCFFKKEELGGVGWISNVAGSRTVTILAAVLRDPAFLVRLLPVRAFLPAVVNLRVAGLAGFRAGVSGRLRLGQIRRTLFLRRRRGFCGGRRLFLRSCQGERR